MTGVALITGGQQGIGLGIACTLRGAGFRVAIASLPEPDSPAVQDALRELGPDVAYFQHDVAEVSAVASLLDAVEQRLGDVTTFISNAGIPVRRRGDMLGVTPEAFDAVVDVNLRGGFFLAQEVARRMLSRSSADYRSLVFITSVSASHASIERAEYCVSKAAAAMMAQLFALRLAPHGIGVFDLRPGIIETEMTAAAREKYTARIADGLVPAGRWGSPADVGEAVLPLITGQMGFATGAVIPVDGGLSIPRL